MKDIAASSYEVYDATGRLCKKGNFDSDNINILELNPGIYHLRIVSVNGEVSTKTFIKE